MELAATITDTDVRDSTIVEIVKAVASAGDTQQAVEVAATITKPDNREEAIGHVVEALALAGDTQRAQETAASATDPKYRAKALIKMASAHWLGPCARAEAIARASSARTVTS